MKFYAFCTVLKKTFMNCICHQSLLRQTNMKCHNTTPTPAPLTASWMLHTRCLESGTGVQRINVTSCYICTWSFVQAMLDCYLLFKLSSERLCKPSCCNAARGTRATSGVDWSCNSMWMCLSTVQCLMSDKKLNKKTIHYSSYLQYLHVLVLFLFVSFCPFYWRCIFNIHSIL